MTLDRRGFLQVGMGATLAALLARRARGDGGGHAHAQAKAKAKAKAQAKACILLYMEGGPSQIDTFDPKPGRETGGDFKAIATRVAGIRISEHLPLLARRMPHLALIRSLTAKEGNHQRARHLMHTGYPPQGGVDHPALGSLVAERRGGARHDLPGYVAIGGPGEDAGFLSAELSPFPVASPSKPVRYLAPPPNVDERRHADRLDLWRGFQDRFAADHASGYVAGQRAVGEEAIAMMDGRGAAGFRIDDEPEKVKAAYGASDFGLGCLMARRLVEAGVDFVEVTLRGWDTHRDNFATVKRLSADLDQGMSALLDDLGARRLLSSTLILWLGDFGRTPRINENGGRDHYPQCQAAVLAGGGVRGGQVIGSTDADGVEIRDRPVTVPDLFRTVARALALDPEAVRVAPSGRPIKTVDGGQEIAGLV
jgi:uncharacterized protein DUF1501